VTSPAKQTNPIKSIQVVLKLIAVIAALVFFPSCASITQQNQDIAVASGFKVITPTTPEQVALLPTLRKGKVTQITRNGKVYYVLPDLKNNQAYVGGPKQYQAYQKLRLELGTHDGGADESVSLHEYGWMGRVGWSRLDGRLVLNRSLTNQF